MDDKGPASNISSSLAGSFLLLPVGRTLGLAACWSKFVYNLQSLAKVAYDCTQLLILVALQFNIDNLHGLLVR